VKRTLTGVSPEQFDRIKSELNQKLGITVASNDGVIDHRGFQIAYRYDPGQTEFAVELLKKPWFVPAALIEQKVDQWLKNSSASMFGPDFAVRKSSDESK
jgi:hypothetical protein